MLKIVFLVVSLSGLVLLGCGSQASQAGFNLDIPEIEVGQWIEYSTNGESDTFTISVAGSENNQGDDCFWIQLNSSDFTAQVLIDPDGIDDAMEAYNDQFGEFISDPAEYIRKNMSDTDGMTYMFGENMDTAFNFLRAVRIIKFEQNGSVMAIDLEGVADFLEDKMNDSSFQDQFQQQFAEGFNAQGGPEGFDALLEEIDNINFLTVETDMNVAGSMVSGFEFTMNHPEGKIIIGFSSDIPLIPLAYARVTTEDETYTITVEGYGFTGAEDLMPGGPAQTIPAMMFLQGMNF